MIEAAGTQSLVGALPVHSLSCKTVDDVTRVREANETKAAIERGGKKNTECGGEIGERKSSKQPGQRD